jgi:RNA polymerase-binding transcription factor
VQQKHDGGDMDTTYESIRARLEDERVSAERQLAEHGAVDEGNGVSVSMNEGFADSAQATAERSQLLSMIEQLRSHHREVVGALERIDAGSYGKCERCGETIPIERLEAIPTARLCVKCKQETGAR